MKAHTIETTRIETATRHSIRTALISLALFFAGCGGGGGGGSAPAAVNGVVSSSPAVQTGTSASSFTMTSDNYGMETATYLAASKSSLGTVLRVAIASSMTDQNFKTVSRIDIPAGAAPAGVYSLGAATASTPAFPGSLYFFNGHQSTLLRTVGGTITFTSYGSNSGDRISGSFSAVVEDGSDPSTPKASYTIAANFDFVTDSYGPVLPAPASAALAAAAIYDANCASCHSLGSHDPTATSAPDLALKGGTMNGMFTADLPSHQGIRLAASDIKALKVLLNIN